MDGHDDEHEDETAALERTLKRDANVAHVVARGVVDTAKLIGAQIVGAIAEEHTPGSRQIVAAGTAGVLNGIDELRRKLASAAVDEAVSSLEPRAEELNAKHAALAGC